ncbi:TEX47 protein, partial [Polyodon spathula]|nr:TEX47 protein [Polyodon spathula]
MSHDIPMRMFQVWSYRSLNNITLTSQEATEQKQPVENLVPECLPLLYKLCVHCLNYLFILFLTINIGTKGVGDNFQEQFLVIEEDNILYLCISNVLHSPEQFLQTYSRPFSVIMDSEIVWPTQSHLYM